VVWAASEERYLIPPEVRVIALVGFMGAFTTWSSYVFETSQMVREGDWWLVAGNVLGSHLLGFVGFFAGLLVGRLL